MGNRIKWIIDINLAVKLRCYGSIWGDENKEGSVNWVLFLNASGSFPFAILCSGTT